MRFFKTIPVPMSRPMTLQSLSIRSKYWSKSYSFQVIAIYNYEPSGDREMNHTQIQSCLSILEGWFRPFPDAKIFGYMPLWSCMVFAYGYPSIYFKSPLDYLWDPNVIWLLLYCTVWRIVMRKKKSPYVQYRCNFLFKYFCSAVDWLHRGRSQSSSRQTVCFKD